MAVIDDLGQPEPQAPPPAEDFGRQPPQDLAAEQSVLGGMLLSKDAIADVLERLRPGISTARPTRTSTTRSWTSTAAVSPPTRSPSPRNWTGAVCCGVLAARRICTP